MHNFAYFCLAIAIATPLWSQVEPSAEGGPTSLDDAQMMTPPPVSGDAYPVAVGAETGRANYVAGGIAVTGAYNDNLMINPSEKIGDSNYSFVPSIELDRRTPRQSESLQYKSGFTLYQNTTSLNGVTQDASAEYRFHLRPFTVVRVRDNFFQNSNLFNQADPSVSTGINPGGSPPNAVYVYPFANQLSNWLDAGIEYQYSRDAMIGGGATYSLLRYATLDNTPGANNSNEGAGSAFFSRRISPGQYLGVNYEYSRITTHPLQANTVTHTVLAFYTLYLTRTVSLSILGGPQHYDSRDSVSGATVGAWTPAFQGSVGYQMHRTSFSASYSRIVAGARGLAGAYHSNLASLTASRQITRSWVLGGGAGYSLFKSATPDLSQFNQGGHSISGSVSAERSVRERIHVQIGYSHFHQSYNFGANTLLYPDCNREFASISYGFSRPLGR